MASAQGIVRFAGVPLGRVFYSSYYKNNQGGSPPDGPGAGARASQWLSGVYITEDSGLYGVSVNSDNFCGAASTVAAGDQLVILFWRDTTTTPAQAGGSFFSGQSRTTGKGGTHALGFKYDNGASPIANYGDVDQFYYVVFTMTGQAWAATPGGVGGDINGDITLVLNAGPMAVISGVSTNPAAPTPVTRGAVVTMVNSSADAQTARAYTAFSQIFFEQSSAAHDPSGGTQASDGSAPEGSTFSFSEGITYGQPFGVIVPGDGTAPSAAWYTGPQFKNHTHAFPHIDIYGVDLMTLDDNAFPLSASATFYYKTFFTTPTATFALREYCPWDQYVLDPMETNVEFDTAGPNTIDAIVQITAVITDPQAGAPRSYDRFDAGITLDGSPAFVINQPFIADGLPAQAPFGFLTVMTRGGADVRHVYEVVGVNGLDELTIDTAGSTLAYTAKDWFFTSLEPAGGTDLHYSWEVNENGVGWVRLGKLGTFTTSVAAVATIHQVGIGAGVLPGWTLRIIDGQARGFYIITAVPSDDDIAIDSLLLFPAAAGDAYEIGCPDGPALWAQRENSTLSFRIVGTYSTGWPSSGTYVHQTAFGPVTNSGLVGNLPPLADVATATESGASTTYTFDGRRSYGTATTWLQQSVFAAAQVMDGSAMCVITDPNLDTSVLRDGHAWLAVVNASGHIVAVYEIIDVDRETPDVHVAVINTQGSTATYPAGTAFRTTNNYEIEGSNLDNDIASYVWRLRSADTPQTQPTSAAEFELRFPRVDGAGTGETWAFTYSGADAGRSACIELVVTDAAGAQSTTWVMFTVVVTPGVATAAARRIEWD